MPLQIIVCGSLVPDPLQSLIPVAAPDGFGLKNEMMLPHVLDPWAGHALYEAAHLAKQIQGSKVYLVCLAQKAKLQQSMMTIAQKVPFELVAVDASHSGFTDSFKVAEILAETIQSMPGIDSSNMLIFGGWESASRAAGTTMQIIGEKLGIVDQFQGVDEIKVNADGSFQVLERVEGGKHQVSVCASPPAVFGWATGNLPEPPNNPQVGMMNMRTVMPAIQKAQAASIKDESLSFQNVQVPAQRRETKIVKDLSIEEIASEIVTWLKES